jgi:hypothetical protein
MDSSLNLIDLQYLSNPYELNKLMRNKEILNVSTDDIKFYKKRIFQLTKDLLRGQDKDVKIKRAFKIYAKTCIEHFKFQDKMEIIQKDYKNIKKSVKKKTTFNLDNTNNIMMKNKKARIPKITDNIKITSTRTIKPPIMPKQRNFDLKNSKFKEKGLKKKI